MSATEITYEIKKHIGVISTMETGWKKEVNIVAWNGGQDKVDIRDWDPEHKKMSRGITLTLDQGKALKAILENI